jgi:tRNA modification GTPase
VQTKSDTPAQRSSAPPGTIAVSAINNIGLDALRHAIAQSLASATASLTAETLALQPRHEEALRSARASLADAIDRVAPQRERRALAGPELIAGALRQSLDALACLGGEMTPDDVIGLVFARFCVGK